MSRFSTLRIGPNVIALTLAIASSAGCTAAPPAGALPGVVPAEPSPTAPAVVSASPASCTLIGCIDMLLVEIKGNVPKEYEVEVTAPDGATLKVHCVDGQESTEKSGEQIMSCTKDRTVTFFEFTPEEVLVSLTWEGGNLMQSFKPAYNTNRPNGPGCEPECKKGVVELYIP